MKEVKIEIYNIEKEEMGIKQPIQYALLKFNEAHFLGYFVHKADSSLITFYLGSHQFICKNIPYNVELFESIMK